MEYLICQNFAKIPMHISSRFQDKIPYGERLDRKCLALTLPAMIYNTFIRQAIVNRILSYSLDLSELLWLSQEIQET